MITVENTCCHITLEVPVILFRTTVPTPFVPFTVMRRGAAAGVMVTASHNPRFPKEPFKVGTKRLQHKTICITLHLLLVRWDNGYKVYWGNGAQILAPHDKNIQVFEILL